MNVQIDNRHAKSRVQQMIAAGLSIIVCLLIIAVAVYSAVTQTVIINDSVTMSTDGQAMCNIKVWKTHGPNGTAFGGNYTDVSGTAFNASNDIATEVNSSNLIGSLTASPTLNTATFGVTDRLKSSFSYIAAQYDVYKIVIQNTSSTTPARYSITGVTSSALAVLSGQVTGYYGSSVVSVDEEWILGNDIAEETYVGVLKTVTIFVVIALANASSAENFPASNFSMQINVYAAYGYIAPPQKFEFEITTTDGTFIIPTSAYMNNNRTKAYTWKIYINDILATSTNGIVSQPVSGIQSNFGGSTVSAGGGIQLTNLSSGTHKITIEQAGTIDAWLGAFGFDSNTTNACSSANKNKVTKVLSAFTLEMTRTQAQISNPAVYAPPANEYFALFYNCTNITMGPRFNLPQEITVVGDIFADSLFFSCNGVNFTMNNIFNLPQGVTAAGTRFASMIFYNCRGAGFAMNSIFNLPQNIATAGITFAGQMFNNAGNASFQINGVFKFPVLTQVQLDQSNVFYGTFQLNASCPAQTRTAASIINGNPTPSAANQAFNNKFSDFSTIHVNWRV